MKRIEITSKVLYDHLESKLSSNKKAIVDDILKESKGKKQYYKHHQRNPDLPFGWVRSTFIVYEPKLKKLKQIAMLKGVDIKDVINSLIDIYINNAVTTRDVEKIKQEKQNLISDIKQMNELLPKQKT